VLDENGKLVTVTMGSYGVGVTRLVAVIAEATHDDKGLLWPESVSPADVHLITAGKDEAAALAVEELARALEAAGKTVLIDDRAKVSPGVKFADAELLGIPRILIAGRGVADGEVELWDRRSGVRRPVRIESAVAELTKQV
jgi:prolyl-tRNA synthetase